MYDMLSQNGTDVSRMAQVAQSDELEPVVERLAQRVTDLEAKTEKLELSLGMVLLALSACEQETGLVTAK